ncbi:MAG: aminotransferase class I/II-fold pyridoxal phosphate-dependent enzyme [Gammaproteobacteria bacterium]|nr:aminotransferase class I/II-fold pyridoxal phosphate-dependent enzyme [Gammaproteobacteria bacterium]
MKEGRINLYSDTQTRPSAAMREAMMQAPVGDEQSLADPSVNLLCERTAALMGKEAAVFLPSGTMCNEIALMVHCRPGDEIFAHESAHITHFEGGGPSALSGAHVRSLPGERGVFSTRALQQAIRPDSRYFPRARLVEIEQTANLAGGTLWSLEEIKAVTALAREHGLSVHMDGARLANAVVASGISFAEYAVHCDSVWLDLSKGLGCPVGAVLTGSAAFIDEVWRWKQRIGGAMRQAGMLAAAGIYALEHNIERLAEDHANAKRFGALIRAVEGVRLTPAEVETNIVFFDVAATGVDADTISEALENRGINVGAFTTTTLRACTHLDVTAAQVEEAGAAFAEVVEQLR